MEEQKRTFPASQDPDKFREDMARYRDLAIELGATDANTIDRDEASDVGLIGSVAGL